ncbi:MAG: hypothetical protein LBT91_00720 [Bifidobacteriaceae bacterium]|jgi:hypothetical protein|nr:hypothetical protein [Bifidobacteriaceae bacterium]
MQMLLITPEFGQRFRIEMTKKFAFILLLIIFPSLTYIGGFAYASDSNSFLPIARGGMGANTFASEQALIGNGTQTIQTKAIDTNPAANSTNLITSGAVQNVKNYAGYTSEFNTVYKTYFRSYYESSYNIPRFFVIGEVPQLNQYSPQATNFFGNYYYIRDGDSGSYSCANDIHIDIGIGYNKVVSEKTVQATQLGKICASGNGPQPEIGTFIYDEVKYIGITNCDPNNCAWMAGNVHLIGRYIGTLPISCDKVAVCFGSIIYYDDTTNYTPIWKPLS